jgi:hypothetical protein
MMDFSADSVTVTPVQNRDVRLITALLLLV